MDANSAPIQRRRLYEEVERRLEDEIRGGRLRARIWFRPSAS